MHGPYSFRLFTFRPLFSSPRSLHCISSPDSGSARTGSTWGIRAVQAQPGRLGQPAASTVVQLSGSSSQALAGVGGLAAPAAAFNWTSTAGWTVEMCVRLWIFIFPPLSPPHSSRVRSRPLLLTQNYHHRES